MAHKACPWRLGYWLLFPGRRLLQDPAEIIEPFIRDGMTVLEVGPGMGFFSLELARRVGPNGRVVCAELEPRMLASLDPAARNSASPSRSSTSCRTRARSTAKSSRP